MLDKYICAVDIGSSKISAAVARVRKRRVVNIFFETGNSVGVKRGAVLDAFGLIDALGKTLNNLKAKSGINIKSIYTNISGEDIVTKHAHAIIPLAERGNKVIMPSDIRKVNEEARILGSNLEEEIIHAMPFSYAIDSKDNITNPLGLYSHRLEVDLYLVCGKLSSLQSLVRAVNQAGYEIKDIFFSGLATSRAVFNQEFKPGVNILCDIGSDITELLIFSGGLLRAIAILSLGGDDLTADISDKLKIPFELAEDIKRSHAIAGDYIQIKEDKQILIKKNNLYKPISQRLISQIVTSRVKLICQAIRETLQNNPFYKEADNFFISGRAILLEGFMEMLENSLEVPVKLSRASNAQLTALLSQHDLTGGQRYLTYLTCLGIIEEAVASSQPDILTHTQKPASPLSQAINRIKEVYSEYF